MKAKYECEICRLQHNTPEAAMACEAKGNASKWKEDDKVQFLHEKSNTWITGVVSIIEYSQMNHEPLYTVMIDPDTSKRYDINQTFVGNFPEKSGRIRDVATEEEPAPAPA